MCEYMYGLNTHKVYLYLYAHYLMQVEYAYSKFMRVQVVQVV